jgi:type II secretory pathway pseudopilin PulG
MKYPTNKGLILINVLVFAVIAVTVTLALTNWAISILRSTRQLTAREQAFQIAEAGIDYYRWHLAHDGRDFTDGNGDSASGPFTHDFKDKDGNVIGQFALTITEPPTGSTVVTVKSKGTVLEDPLVSRTIQVKLSIPSLAKYSIVANDTMRFGVGTEIFGAVHSNYGIRFDGVAHNLITSSKDTYVDTDVGLGEKFGVYTAVTPADPAPPGIPPTRPDIFAAGRQFPVSVIDFIGMTSDLSGIKTAAQMNGRYFAPSGAQGYHVVLKTNDTFDLYKVTSITPLSVDCMAAGSSEDRFGSWSIQTQTFVQNYPFPSNGAMFFEDNVWVDGKIRTAKLTIAAGRFPDSPTTWKSIIVNQDLLYTTYDGKDVISLIAQGDITTGFSSLDTLRIDAALVAQNGRAGRPHYSTVCGTGHTRTSLTLFGSIVTNARYGFAYTDGTGYITRNLIYDANLFSAPPPNFPVTSDQYVTDSWDEVK